MISIQWRELFITIFKIVIVLFLIDLFQSTFLISAPKISYFIIPMHILMVIYFSFRFPVPYLPSVVTLVSLVHSLFTLEGPGLEIMASLLISLTIVSIKDLIQLSSWPIIIVFVYLVQILWSLICGLLLAIKIGDWSIVGLFLKFSVLEGLVGAALSPIIFKGLHLIFSQRSVLFLASGKSSMPSHQQTGS